MSHPEAIYRKIIHIDMDAFYASIEQRDFPEYRGKPLIVGGSPAGRGVVATASYEARQYGVRSAMSTKKALQLCPHAIVVFPRFEAYRAVSSAIRAIFKRYTDQIEPLSLDEAYLDVTIDKLGIGSAIEIAQQIREAIRHELQLTASAGVSVNKFIAKVASDINKPDGLAFIGPSRIEAFMETLPVEQFFGVGKVTSAKMKAMQLYTGKDIKQLTEGDLVQRFGKLGRFLYQIVRGVDHRPVQAQRKTKSVSVEETFVRDLSAWPHMDHELAKIAQQLSARLAKHQLEGRTLTLKVRFADFSMMTRSRSFARATHDYATLYQTARALLEPEVHETDKTIRLLGLTVSNFGGHALQRKHPEQLSLF